MLDEPIDERRRDPRAARGLDERGAARGDAAQPVLGGPGRGMAGARSSSSSRWPSSGSFPAWSSGPAGCRSPSPSRRRPSSAPAIILWSIGRRVPSRARPARPPRHAPGGRHRRGAHRLPVRFHPAGDRPGHRHGRADVGHRLHRRVRGLSPPPGARRDPAHRRLPGRQPGGHHPGPVRVPRPVLARRPPPVAARRAGRATVELAAAAGEREHRRPGFDHAQRRAVHRRRHRAGLAADLGCRRGAADVRGQEPGPGLARLRCRGERLLPGAQQRERAPGLLGFRAEHDRRSVVEPERRPGPQPDWRRATVLPGGGHVRPLHRARLVPDRWPSAVGRGGGGRLPELDPGSPAGRGGIRAGDGHGAAAQSAGS